MPWIVLVVSGVLEAVWATALGQSDGLSRPGPTVVFFAALALSMAGLAISMRGIPISVAYSVWIGIGAALTVGWAMATGAESASPLKLLFLAGIIGCVVGLKFVKSETSAPAPVVEAASTGPDSPTEY